ncbi:MAG: PIN domain-containing protein [Oscillospiraceae bacterium]|jgi:predicted nucleic acid-binding protein|nr:PIN domain-containing protein [Oscillospiraceae bacterium]
MKNKAFVDTNIMVYLYSGDEPIKRGLAIKTMEQFECCISIQVLNEFAAVFLRKFRIPAAKVLDAINEITEHVAILPIDENTVRKALLITERHGFSYYDSMIIAAALEGGCGILLSEDMQHGQLVDERLTIRSVFISSD